MLTWFCCWLCTFQGVKISGYVVWFTVPMPVIFVFIMVLNGFTLKNSDYGFRMYLKGYENDEEIDVWEKLQTPAIWSEACGQIFFTLSICWGVMVSYASYMDRNAPVIKNGVAVALINCSFSFFAGFAVFATVGYLVGIKSPVSNEYSSMGLAFIAFPAAIETMPAPNFWAIMIFATLFLLGIDSAFAIVEGTVVVIEDSAIGKRFSKAKISSIICMIGAAMSTIFCFNWSFALYDVVDHYLNIYTIMLMGVLQAIVTAWYHRTSDAFKLNAPASLVLVIGYFGALIPLPWLQYFIFKENAGHGIWTFWLWFAIVAAVSYSFSQKNEAKGRSLTFTLWYEDIFFAGVKPICAHICALSEKEWSNFGYRLF